MTTQSDVLLVGQTPPPFHGQAIVTQMLFDYDWGELKVCRLRMSYSESLEGVGKFKIGKLWHLVSLIVKTWWIALTQQPKILYYLPASPNWAPVIRDVLYLAAVRCFFPKLVLHFHAGGLDRFFQQQSLLNRLFFWVYERADCSIDVNVTGPPSGRYFLAKKNVVVMNGIEVNQVTRDRQEDDIFRVLYIGALCEEKGVLGLVKIAKLLKENDRTIQIILVGEWASKEFESMILSLIQEEEVSDVFIIKGRLDGDAKWREFANADSLIFPSHHPTETFGLVLIEAMAFSLPIVATRWRGIPYVVGEDQGAILCDIAAPQQYADAIRKMSEDRMFCQQMGKKGYQRYIENFTEDRFLSKMDKEFKDLLDKG